MSDHDEMLAGNADASLNREIDHFLCFALGHLSKTYFTILDKP